MTKTKSTEGEFVGRVMELLNGLLAAEHLTKA